MTTVFLGDTFSLDDPVFLGRPIANCTLARSIFLCSKIDKVLAVGNPAMYERLELPEEISGKLILVTSIDELVNYFHREKVASIFCSNFGKKYAQLVHFRNLNRLSCPVFGFTHTLSYQDEVGALYRLFCAGVQEYDGILCTSSAAIDVMNNLLDGVRKTLSFKPAGPRLIHFPLGYEATHFQGGAEKCSGHFQVAYLGRLNWMNKADLLVIPRILDCLPEGHDIRFIIAGATNNKDYIQLLRQHCTSPYIKLLQDLSDEDKNRLLGESHVMLSPSDNYQETFGLTVIEAQHHGCVPVVSDFDGYRDLVEHNVNGILLETYAGRIPEKLWNLQILMPDSLYHGWWAAGVSIDPEQAASTLYHLSRNHEIWETMSENAIKSASNYNLDATASRFSRLLESLEKNTYTTSTEKQLAENPFHIDFSTVFRNHPTAFWSDQTVRLTDRGTDFLQEPDLNKVPQLMLLANAITLPDIFRLLESIDGSCCVDKLLDSGTEPVALSVALKNNLIALSAPHMKDLS